MKLAISTFVDGLPACFANEKKGETLLRYVVEKHRIRLAVNHIKKTIPGKFWMDCFLSKNLGCESAVEIQLQESERLTNRGQVTRNITRYTNYFDTRIYVRLNKNIVTTRQLGDQSFFSVRIMPIPQEKKYGLFIHYDEGTEQSASKLDFPLNADDNIRVWFDQYTLEGWGEMALRA